MFFSCKPILRKQVINVNNNIHPEHACNIGFFLFFIESIPMQATLKYEYNERKDISIIISNILGVTAVHKQELIAHYTKDIILDFLLPYLRK